MPLTDCKEDFIPSDPPQWIHRKEYERVCKERDQYRAAWIQAEETLRAGVRVPDAAVPATASQDRAERKAADSVPHTPGPWVARLLSHYTEVVDCFGCEVVHWSGFDCAATDVETARANAAFIVRACNAHEELIAALKDLRDLAAAAFRVIAATDQQDAFIREVDRTGQHVIGAGVRADAALQRAEKGA